MPVGPAPQADETARKESYQEALLPTPNRAARSRHAYSLHVIDGRARYARDNWLQRPPEMPLRGFQA